MNLSDYPTPETDAARIEIWTDPYTESPQGDGDYVRWEKSADLERRLAACRNTLELVLRRGQGMQRSDQYLNEVLSACRQTLTETAPK